MALKDYRITEQQIAENGMISAPDKLTGTAAENKRRFDQLVREVVAQSLNNLIAQLQAPEAAAELGFRGEGLEAATLQRAAEELHQKKLDKLQDAVPGNLAVIGDGGVIKDAGISLEKTKKEIDEKATAAARSASVAETAATIAREIATEDMPLKLSMAESAAESAEKSADAAAKSAKDADDCQRQAGSFMNLTDEYATTAAGFALAAADSAEEAAAAAERAEAADEVFIAQMYVHCYSQISEAAYGGKHVLCECYTSDASCYLPLAGHCETAPYYWAFSGVVGGVVYEARCDVDDNWILLEKPYATMEAVEGKGYAARETVANAITETASGTVVRLDGVSPLAHTVTVKVSGADDPTAVAVKVAGKNLFKPPTAEDLEVLTLLSSAGDEVKRYGIRVLLPAGKYTLSATRADGSTTQRYLSGRVVDAVTGEQLDVGEWNIVYGGAPQTQTREIPQMAEAWFYNNGIDAQWGDAQSRKTAAGGFTHFDILLEAGGTKTEFEPYAAPVSYTPDAEGKVDVLSIAPTMTIMTDTEGVTVEATCNKDTNKVIESLVSAIISLGGNV